MQTSMKPPSNRTAGATESDNYTALAREFGTMQFERDRLREINAELLAALERMVKECEVIPAATLKAARAAIQKAKP